MSDADETIKWIKEVIDDDKSLLAILSRADMHPVYPLALACYYNKKKDLVRRDGYLNRARALVELQNSPEDIRVALDKLSLELV